MKNYKDNAGTLHFLTDEDILNGGENLLPPECLDPVNQITQEEADVIALSKVVILPPPTPVDPVTKLKDFLITNPDVAALLK
jgi:hypothetical protein